MTLILQSLLPAPSYISPLAVTARYNEPAYEKTVGCFLLRYNDQILPITLFEQEKLR